MSRRPYGLARYLASIDSVESGVDIQGVVAAGSLLRASRLVSESIEDAMRSAGVPIGELEVLMALLMHHREVLPTPTQVADELSVSSGAMTKRIDGLQQRGMVVRVPHDHDRRSVTLELTASGRATAETALIAKARATSETMSRDLTTDQLDELIALLERILRPVYS